MVAIGRPVIADVYQRGDMPQGVADGASVLLVGSGRCRKSSKDHRSLSSSFIVGARRSSRP